MNKRFCILAWTLILLAPLALIAGVGWPWLTRVSALESSIAESENQITRYRRVIATLPQLQAELDHERRREDVKAFFYEATTSSLAGAQIQRNLQEMVNGAGAQLRSVRILPIETEEQHAKIGIRADLRCTTESLLDLLYDIEQAHPFLFIDRLSVRSSVRRSTRRTRRARRRRIRRRQPFGQLTVRLTISGYAVVGNG